MSDLIRDNERRGDVGYDQHLQINGASEPEPILSSGLTRTLSLA